MEVIIPLARKPRISPNDRNKFNWLVKGKIKEKIKKKRGPRYELSS